jgi:hypothetical protein
MTGYNRGRPMSFIYRFFGLWMIIAVPLSAVAARQGDAPVAEFANRIYALSGPGPMALTFQNKSTLSSEQISVIRGGIETQLRGLGATLVESAGSQGTQVQVTISRNVRGWLWIAEVARATETKIVMLEVPVASSSIPGTRGSLSLHKQLLFASDAPVLDVLRLDFAGSKLLVALSPKEVTVYQPSGNGWTVQRTVPLDIAMVMPRDPRGHLVVATDHLFDVYLPGVVCASGTGMPVSVTCHAADDLWPLGGQNAFFNASRNYFTGLVRPGFGKPVAPFLSAASVTMADRTTWIFASVDGQVRWTDGGEPQLLAESLDWGSDVASLRTGCGAGTQVIASRRGDGDEALRAYEIMNRQATPASAELPLTGPVVSMWSQTGGGTVTATIKTSKGNYEAYAIEVTCN